MISFLKKQLRRFPSARALLGRWLKKRAYRSWISKFDTLSSRDVQAIAARTESLPRRSIAVIVPAYNTKLPLLVGMIESVRAQLYPHWELCIADDGSSQSHVAQVLSQYQERDPRIRSIRLDQNSGIAAASNAALSLVSSEYTALLDHDDLLAPHALYLVAEAIANDPTIDIIYTDQDKIDASGHRSDPYFKPDWNPELLFGQNYFNHLTVYRTALLRRLGGFRAGFEGSQDYDLALRAVRERSGTIAHLPFVLYHWRIFRGAKTFSTSRLPEATAAARRALTDYFETQGQQVKVSAAAGGGYHRVQRSDPPQWPSISVVIPTRDGLEHLKSVINGLEHLTDYPNFEIIVVDNDSAQPGTLSYFRDLEARGIQVQKSPGEFNFSRINNQAVSSARGELVLLLNNDVEMIEPGWLKEMARYFHDDSVAAVGPKLLYPDGRLQHGGVVIGLGGVAGHIHVGVPGDAPGYFGRLWVAQDVSCVTGACMLVRRTTFDQVGGLDAKVLPVAFNDVDLCLKIRRAGKRIIWTPFAVLIHHESISRGPDIAGQRLARYQRDIRHMKQRWGGALKRDPFYNPNLSLESCRPELSYPPRLEKPWVT